MERRNHGNQPPLVDATAACLCRVDAGLKTVAGAKKLVPGAKTCQQPNNNIGPSVQPCKYRASRGEGHQRSQPPLLLPGLPDDLAIAFHRSCLRRWQPVSDGMVGGWRNPSVCLNGQLFALDCKDGCRLRVYDEATGSWSKHVDSKMHLGSSQATEAAALVPLNGKLCIIRNNTSISLVDVTSAGGSMARRWETMAGKGQMKAFMANLLSNLAGRNRLKSHIVHCQVLQA